MSGIVLGPTLDDLAAGRGLVVAVLAGGGQVSGAMHAGIGITATVDPSGVLVVRGHQDEVLAIYSGTYTAVVGDPTRAGLGLPAVSQEIQDAARTVLAQRNGQGA